MREIILIGTPNAGKTTLFNWLTGRSSKVVNYPGSTVEYSVGEILPNLIARSGHSIKVYDSPGTYSLFPKSPEEEVTVNLLRRETGEPSYLVVVVDSTQIDRQVALLEQLKELGLPLVVAMTMWDLHKRDGKELSAKKLSEHLQVPVVPIDGRLGGGVKELVQVIDEIGTGAKPVGITQSEWNMQRYQSVFRNSSQFLSRNVTKDLSAKRRTEKIDRIALHPIFGTFLFVVLMGLVFSSIFWAAAPLMDLVDSGFGAMAEFVRTTMPDSLLQEFISEGIIASVGAVLVFVPQIFILFIGISILEDSGYLSRAAALVDRPLSYFGLNGRSFVPMLSGFACAVPAIMAARTISNPKARWLTVFILPLMACSARLPVYTLLLAFLFWGQNSFYAGIAMTGLYLGAVVIGLIASKLVSKLLGQGQSDFFMMELPLYRMPSFRSVVVNAFRRTNKYIVGSGPIIFIMAALLWVAATFPRYDLQGSARLESSYAGRTGQILEPLFTPMGGDWRVGISLISAFAAREVFVSSLAVVMNIGEVDEANQDGVQQSLLTSMHSARTLDNQRQLFSVASVVALIVFFMIALQCTTTVGVVIREMGSWTYGLGQLLAMNAVAYVLAVIIFQTLKAFGFDT